MPKRLTATELGDTGPVNPDFAHRKLLIEVQIGYPGSAMTDLIIGSERVTVRNDSVRQAALEAGFEEPDVRSPVAYLRDLDDTGSLHVCAKGDPGAIPVYDQ